MKPTFKVQTNSCKSPPSLFSMYFTVNTTPLNKNKLVNYKVTCVILSVEGDLVTPSVCVV